MSMYFLSETGVLMTTNNGWDKKTVPFISVDEFLGDCSLVDNYEIFKNLLDELYRDEIVYLPLHMKKEAVKIIVDWRKNYATKYLYWKNKTI